MTDSWKKNAKENLAKSKQGTEDAEESPMIFERCRLKTARDVRSFQARIIRKGVRGDMKSADVYKYCLASSMLLKSIEISDLEQRIKDLEGSK